MLNSIKLTNFRQHTDLEMSFGLGMTAIRGANENGKTTVIESIAYALFGTAALRDSIDEVVTWGAPANSLKVELDFSIEGVAYNIKRGKASAELTYDGGIVTNQKEVTSYACRLLKVDAAAAARLTMSNQGSIRGALEAGPKATTELIEKLAEFDQIDHLIELMQEKLTLGSTAVTEAAILGAQDNLDRAKLQAIPTDTTALQALILDSAQRVQTSEVEVNAAEVAQESAQEAHGAARERIVARVAAAQESERARATVQQLTAKLADQARLSLNAPDNVEVKVAALQQQIADATSAGALKEAYAKVLPHTKSRDPEKATFEGSLEGLQSDLAKGVAAGNSGNLSLSRLDGEVRLLEQSLTHGSCTFCGKDFSGVPEVATKNLATTEKIAALKAERVAISQQVKDQAVENEILRDIEMASRPVFTALSAVGGRAELVDNELPPVLRWVGASPADQLGTPASMQAEIRALQAAQSAYTLAVSRAEDFKRDLLAAQTTEASTISTLEGMPEETITGAQEVLDVARAETIAARTRLTLATGALTDAERTLKDQQAAYDRAVAAVVEYAGALESRKQELETLEFNNALLKRVRQCRPIISDKLWAIVLNSVSSYFSDIRGTPSEVTKEVDGFKVDGHSVTSLSGSTLDALGLAIRVALVRTFLPSATFLTLDEPGAAMDEQRTANMLGFLSKCAFNQVLLVSHSDMPEEVADHIHLLGAN